MPSTPTTGLGNHRPRADSRRREILVLDTIPNAIYHSLMKQMTEGVETVEPGTVESGTVAGATLFSFLDTADVLYTRISEALKAAGLSYAKYDVLHQLRKAKGPVSLRLLAEN